MAKCNTCGTEISFLNYERECDSCAEIRVNQWRVRQTARTNLKNAEISEQSKAINENKAEQALLNEAKAKLIAEQAELRKNTWIDQQVAGFTSKLSNDAPMYLFQRIYCPVDSLVNNEDLANDFRLEAVEQLGADGWQIVGIVPRTIGVGLKNTSYGNTSGTTWGAGMGGNVAGVYVLLQLNVTLANVNQLMPTIKVYFGSKYRVLNS